MHPAELADRIELFFGAGSEAMCRVYARLNDPAAPAAWRIEGSLTGPSCAYAETLPATFRFVDRGPGGPPLAEALVPEPNLWSPEMPHLYQAELTLLDGDQPLAHVERMFGVRPLGTAGSRLRYGGKGWVLRAVHHDAVVGAELADWHTAENAMAVDNPNDELCAEASRIGVLLIVSLDASTAGEAMRLCRWPAVGMIVLPADLPELPDGLGRNVLVAQRFAAGQQPKPLAGVAAIVCEVDSPDAVAAIESSLPVIVLRPSSAISDVAAGRAACDRLQRDLAPVGQFAGYIVVSNPSPQLRP